MKINSRLYFLENSINEDIKNKLYNKELALKYLQDIIDNNKECRIADDINY